MNDRDPASVQNELAELRRRIAQLEEQEDAAQPPDTEWTRRYYLSYYATTGFFLGMLAAVTSLVLNIIGSLLVGKHPLELIKVYLTFGLGEKALDPLLDSGMVLAIGCCLYIATGMLLGVVFQVVLSRFADHSTLIKRLAIASGLAIVVWVVNYYLLLSWLEPLLFGGNWIVDSKYLPPWVAVLTHLVFGWTMALVYPLGAYEPYRVRTE
ncbi:MAG: hypothetical protein K8R36_21855 [Planctomycetales bacterium]|nr:hypothetical protein [Planctomycetales bacterium]